MDREATRLATLPSSNAKGCRFWLLLHLSRTAFVFKSYELVTDRESVTFHLRATMNINWKPQNKTIIVFSKKANTSLFFGLSSRTTLPKFVFQLVFYHDANVWSRKLPALAWTSSYPCIYIRALPLRLSRWEKRVQTCHPKSKSMPISRLSLYIQCAKWVYCTELR